MRVSQWLQQELPTLISNETTALEAIQSGRVDVNYITLTEDCFVGHADFVMLFHSESQHTGKTVWFENE